MLGTEDIRRYQVHLLEAKASWPIFNQTVCALRFLYRVTLQRDWPLERLQYGKRPKRLHVVLSQKEELRFLGAIDNPKYRVALTTEGSCKYNSVKYERRGARGARREEGEYRCVFNRRATTPLGMDRRSG